MKYLYVLLVAVVLLATQLACEDTPVTTNTTTSNGGGYGQGWLACSSLTCTYRVGWNAGKPKTAVAGTRISTQTASPLSGKWIPVTR
jgi:hypothetical protein